MKTLALICGILLALVVGIVVVWQQKYPTYTYRYKLTVEVNTPQGVKSGSSVVEVKTIQYPRWAVLGANAENTTIKGEATVVNLGEGGALFVLLQTDSALLAPRTFLGVDFHSRPLAKHARQLSQMIGQKADVPMGYIPRIVRFRDMNDPTSVELVLQTEMCKRRGERNALEYYDCIKTDHFADIFGEGVKLIKATLTITDESVGSEIETLLPWLSEYKNKLFDGRTIHTIKAENRLVNSLGMGSFKVE